MAPLGAGHFLSNKTDKNVESPEQVFKRQPKNYWSRKDERIWRTRKQGWLIERIWPEGTVHLIAGPSGVGKTTWLLPSIKAWSEGLPVLGYPTHPQEYVYLMCDRSETDLQRTLDRLQLSDWDVHAYSIESLGHDPRCMIDPSTLTIEALPKMFPWARVFFIEAYNWFYKGNAGGKGAVGDYQNTLRFWSSVRDAFSQLDLTIVATTHEAKGNEYTKTRDKVYGNVGQVAVAGTIMTMEYHEKDPDTRYLRVAPRDSKELVCEYKFNEKGSLDFKGEGTDEERQDPQSFKLLDGKLRRCQPGENIPTATLIAWGIELSLSDATVERWILRCIKTGKLVRIARGLFCVPTEQ